MEYKLQKTNNYDKFKTRKNNRKIVASHILKLVKSMKQEYLVSPIIVNEKYEIIDGQHRFLAIKKLNLPVFYLKVPYYGDEQIQLYNISQRNWSMTDFLEYHKNKGNRHYKELALLMNKYNISLACARVFTSKMIEGRYPSDEKFREGEFVIEVDDAEEIIKKFSEIRNYWDFSNQRNFASAIRQLLRNPQVDWQRMGDAIKQYNHLITRAGTSKEYMKMFQKLYNFNRLHENRVRLYEEEL